MLIPTACRDHPQGGNVRPSTSETHWCREAWRKSWRHWSGDDGPKMCSIEITLSLVNTAMGNLSCLIIFGWIIAVYLLQLQYGWLSIATLTTREVDRLVVCCVPARCWAGVGRRRVRILSNSAVVTRFVLTMVAHNCPNPVRVNASIPKARRTRVISSDLVDLSAVSTIVATST